MEELREFKYNINGIPHTFQLDKAGAVARGLEWEEKPADKKPANKSAKPASK